MNPSNKKQLRELALGIARALVFKGGAAGSNLLLNIVLGRLLGPAGAGLFYLAYTCALFTAVLGRAGTPNAVTRFVSAYSAEGDWPSTQAVANKALVITLTLSTLAAISIAGLAPWLGHTLFSDAAMVQPLRIAAVAVPWLALGLVVAQMLRALEYLGRSILVQSLLVPLVTAAALLIFRVTQASTALALLASASFLVVLLGLYWWIRRVPSPFGSYWGQFSTGTLLRTSWPLMLISLMAVMINWAPTFLLGALSTTTEAGLYAVAWRTAQLVSFVLLASNTFMAPRFARMHHQQKRDALHRQFLMSNGLLAAAAIAPAAILIAFSDSVMGIYGAEFLEASDVLVILTLGQYVNVATGSAGFFLMMTGREIVYRNITFVAGGATIGLCLALVPPYGAMGAAFATATGLALVNLAAMVIAWQALVSERRRA